MPIPKALNTNATASGVTAFGCNGREREVSRELRTCPRGGTQELGPVSQTQQNVQTLHLTAWGTGWEGVQAALRKASVRDQVGRQARWGSGTVLLKPKE